MRFYSGSSLEEQDSASAYTGRQAKISFLNVLVDISQSLLKS